MIVDTSRYKFCDVKMAAFTSDALNCLKLYEMTLSSESEGGERNEGSEGKGLS